MSVGISQKPYSERVGGGARSNAPARPQSGNQTAREPAFLNGSRTEPTGTRSDGDLLTAPASRSGVRLERNPGSARVRLPRSERHGDSVEQRRSRLPAAAPQPRR